jgi:hypothetical protein
MFFAITLMTTLGISPSPEPLPIGQPGGQIETPVGIPPIEAEIPQSAETGAPDAVPVNTEAVPTESQQ